MKVTEHGEIKIIKKNNFMCNDLYSLVYKPYNVLTGIRFTANSLQLHLHVQTPDLTSSAFIKHLTDAENLPIH